MHTLALTVTLIVKGHRVTEQARALLGTRVEGPYIFTGSNDTFKQLWWRGLWEREVVQTPRSQQISDSLINYPISVFHISCSYTVTLLTGLVKLFAIL